MEHVVVSVRVPGSPAETELALPIDLPGSQLTALVAQAVGLEHRFTSYALEDMDTRRHLHPAETLAAARIWDGGRLTLHVQAVATMDARQQPVAPRPNAAPGAAANPPQIGWSPLGPPATPGASP